MDKYEIAQILREIGTIIKIIDSQPDKGFAYHKAARSIEEAHNFETLLKTDELETLPGIGQKISSYIKTLSEHGQLPYYQYLKGQIPLSLLELTLIPGLTHSKIRILFEALQVTSLDSLKQALQEKKLSGLKGFPPSIIKKLESRIKEIGKSGFSLLYPQAKRLSEALQKALETYAEKVSVTGSMRRLLETVNSLDFIVVCSKPEECLAQFKRHSLVVETLLETTSSTTVLLKQGIEATVQIVSEQDYPLQLLKSTGTKKHILKLKKINKLKNRYSDEADIYQSSGLHYIPPELREGYGEIERAKTSDFSDLIKYTDLKGVFHCHTIFSDGHATIEKMAEAAMNKGWNYIGISDHSRSSSQANGLTEEELLAQIELIHSINTQLPSFFKIFAGLECDILKDGQLDFSDSILKELDFVIISIHSLFKLEKKEMTKRLIKAIENPYATMLGHVTGRLLRLRDPYQLDLAKVIDACIANGKVIELNASPARMDMDWREWSRSRDKGLKCSINPDAHTTQELDNCIYGVNCARKGWLKKEDVINTLSLEDMVNYLKCRRPK